MSQIATPARPLRLWWAHLLIWLRNLAIVLFVLLVVPLLAILLGCNSFGTIEPDPLPTPEPALAPAIQTTTAEYPGYARPEEQTYLTLPEWYIVYNADEYAAFVQNNLPSRFPYFRAVGQFWSSYRDVCLITRTRYTFNRRYHTILYVIGVSFSFESIAKGIYEKTIGRLSEWTSSASFTEEDLFAAAVAEEYGTFMHTIPWFEFPFRERLRSLWATTSRQGPNQFRKWERKFYLSMEYGGKAIYGGMIRSGNEASFVPQDLVVLAVVQGLTPDILSRQPEIALVAPINATTDLVSLPRYEAFTLLAPELARQGLRFVELAGNNEIMVTILTTRGWSYALGVGKLLFGMPILTLPHQQRLVVQTPVSDLHQLLLELETHNLELEHIYDY